MLGCRRRRQRRFDRFTASAAAASIAARFEPDQERLRAHTTCRLRFRLFEGLRLFEIEAEVEGLGENDGECDGEREGRESGLGCKSE